MRLPVLVAIVLVVLPLGALPPQSALAAKLAPGDPVAVLTVSLEPPATVTYGGEIAVSGQLSPAWASVGVDLQIGATVVAQTQTAADGSFTFKLRPTSPGPYTARSGTVTSAPVTIPIRPILRTSVQGRHIVGQELRLRSSLLPAAAGKLRVTTRISPHKRIVRRLRAGERATLPTPGAGRYVAWITLEPSAGYASVGKTVRYEVGSPSLYMGSHGRSVRLLERELVKHHFALSRVDASFDYDTLEAIYALQKMAGLARTGSVNSATWLALARAKPPRPQLRGSYIEVDKTKQVLYVVRNRKVTLIVPVSTGASGNTPIGVFHVYSKVPGGAVMYYSNYFTGAFAIHGYVSVPPYPASHGCVRVPIWVAVRLYGLIPYNTRVLIHY
jgi:hypothetical protein